MTPNRDKPVDLTDNDEFIVGSGNYLADRGYADPAAARAAYLLGNEIEVALERLHASKPD
jgi:hypothetical protein